MPTRIPLYIDRSGTPFVGEVPVDPSNLIPARTLPLATTGEKGAMSAADKVALDGTPAAIAAAVAAEAVARSSADASEASTRAIADASLDARLDLVEAGVAALDPLGEQNEAANLTTAAPLTPPEELGLFKQRNASTGALELRALHPGAELELELVGDSLRIGRRPVFWTPPRSFARRGRGYRDVRRQGIRTAGEQGDTTRLADNHGSSHLFPFMLWSALDWFGFPHNRHKRLESSSLGNDSGELGYEFGHDVAAGDFRDGRGLVWRGRGLAENVGWADAFWDWTLEVNPTAGNFAGANRLRMISPDLDATWSGLLRFDWEVELRSEGWRAYSVRGTWRIFSATGRLLREWSSLVGTSSGFDWLAADARVQLRWRVDRDQANRIDTFDATNQGAGQGANRLRCSVRSYALDFDGFPKD